MAVSDGQLTKLSYNWLNFNRICTVKFSVYRYVSLLALYWRIIIDLLAILLWQRQKICVSTIA